MSPVPKDKEELYGKVVGHLQNIGYGREVAKNKADQAVASQKNGKDSPSKKKTTSKKKKTTKVPIP